MWKSDHCVFNCSHSKINFAGHTEKPNCKGYPILKNPREEKRHSLNERDPQWDQVGSFLSQQSDNKKECVLVKCFYRLNIASITNWEKGILYG